LTLKVTNTSDRLVIESESPEETLAAARCLGEALFSGACIALYGELGSGKTVFARGVIHGLGVAESVAVTSPTFVIVSEYEGRFPIHHVDAYRLAGTKDLFDLGSRELFYSGAVSIVEWADRVAEELPEERLDAALALLGPSARRIEITSRGEKHRTLLAALGAATRKIPDVTTT